MGVPQRLKRRKLTSSDSSILRVAWKLRCAVPCRKGVRSKMAKLCVIYPSKDEGLVKSVVEHLRTHWEVWWAKDITHGSWQRAVLCNISDADGIVAVVSKNTDHDSVFRDELERSITEQKAVFVLEISEGPVPLGIGHLNRTIAHGFDGSKNHPGLIELIDKITRHIQYRPTGGTDLPRADTLCLAKKTLSLPNFAFSVSSHETQLDLVDAIPLLQELSPPASLISAYDIPDRLNQRGFSVALRAFCNSPTVVVSGYVRAPLMYSTP